MTLLMILLACGDKEAVDTANSELEQEQSEEGTAEPSSEDTNTDPGVVPKPVCKMLTAFQEYNGDVTMDEMYTWNGLVQTSSDGTYTYNDKGYILSSSTTDSSGYVSDNTYTYDCGWWCKMQRHISSQGYEGEEPATLDVTYVWNDNVQSTTEGGRSWTYNDMGYVTESVDAGDGYETRTTTEYTCDDVWCKDIRTTSVTLVDGLNPIETVLEYTWSGNVKTWDQNTVTYNEFGYVTETILEESLSQVYAAYTYDCQ